VLLVFWCTQFSLNFSAGNSLLALSQEIGVYTGDSSSPYPSSYSTKCDEHLFYGNQSQKSIAIRTSLFGECVKTCTTLSTVPMSVELQSVPWPHFTLFHQPRTYHATVQLLHMLVVAFQIHFFNVFASHSRYLSSGI
jgi:hypothetical protein